jgi:hypothetical protein
VVDLSRTSNGWTVVQGFEKCLAVWVGGRRLRCDEVQERGILILQLVPLLHSQQGRYANALAPPVVTPAYTCHSPLPALTKFVRVTQLCGWCGGALPLSSRHSRPCVGCRECSIMPHSAGLRTASAPRALPLYGSRACYYAPLWSRL